MRGGLTVVKERRGKRKSSYITIDGRKVRCEDFPCFEKIVAAKAATESHGALLGDLKRRVEKMETEESKASAQISQKLDEMMARLDDLHSIKTNGGPPRQMKEVVMELWQTTENLRAKRAFSQALGAWAESHPRLQKLVSTRLGVTLTTIVGVWLILALLNSFGVDVEPWAIVKMILGYKPTIGGQ